ncbi:MULTISPECIES: hypothetical protein [unclassified Streptomyces]|uniref:hypothetical protein n=1 Tax=unclassified Streptomyces TaxID=2593676 RepID=UPI0036B0B213
MRTPVRAVTAVSLALLVTACGGGQGGGDQAKGRSGESTAGVSATPSAPPRKALTLAELEEAIVGQGDLKGYAVEERKGPGIGSPSVTVDKEACKPLADALYSIPHHLAFATAETTMAETPKAGGVTAPGNAATDLSLSSYEADGAQEALAAVKTSASACRKGFTFTVVDETTRVRSVAPLPVAVGDEALAWKIAFHTGGAPHHATVAVFRKGGTVAVASTASGAPGGIAAPPKALLDAQAAKLS